MSRVLYDTEQKIEELMLVKEENQRLKKENEELRSALAEHMNGFHLSTRN